jgi:hypothetical protein
MIIELIMVALFTIAGISCFIGSKRNKKNNKLENRIDKVVTLTGGLAHDRIYEHKKKK